MTKDCYIARQSNHLSLEKLRIHDALDFKYLTKWKAEIAFSTEDFNAF
jgi:hypothetical protein